MTEINFAALREPFPACDIEWRLQSCGKTREGKFWGKALAYITSRAVMTRLDDVFGPAGWEDRYEAGPIGGIMCGIAAHVDGCMITKWDGADKTQVEEIKGGFSDSFKRAAVKWGIGRYLYDLSEGWAEEIHEGRQCSKPDCMVGKTKEGDYFRWHPPILPSWALPSDAPPSRKEQAREESSGSHEEEHNDTSQVLWEEVSRHFAVMGWDKKFWRQKFTDILGRPVGAKTGDITPADLEAVVEYLRAVRATLPEQVATF